MTETNPSFFARFFLAFVAFLRTLFDAEFAGGVVRLRRGELPPPEESEAESEPEQPPAPQVEERPPEAALQLLGILQREGRFVDFLEEDVSTFSDQDIGGAARVVHEGCRKALHEHIELEPVLSEEEGAKITVEQGFDASEIRLTGNVVGEAPFKGTLQHRGWRAREVQLPKIAEEHDVSVIAPAEVEL